jgi:hypothetical protein
VERRGIGNENVLKQRKIWKHEEIIKLIKFKKVDIEESKAYIANIKGLSYGLQR